MSPVSSTRAPAPSIRRTQLWLFARTARSAGASARGWRNSKETPSQDHLLPAAQVKRQVLAASNSCPAESEDHKRPAVIASSTEQSPPDSPLSPWDTTNASRTD